MCVTESLLCSMNSECVSESRDTPTAGNNLMPISAHLQCSCCAGCVHFHIIMYLVTLLTLDSLLIASLWRGRVYKDGYRDQFVTSCGSVSAFQDTFTVHVAQ